MNRVLIYLFSFLFIFGFKISLSQTDSTDIYDLNLSQLSKVKISSVSKTLEKITEVPSTVFLITASEIKEKGYFTLEEAISDLPGFQFRNINGFNSYVFQRGVPSQNNLILVLIDGIQVNELNSGGFYGGGQYNLSNVERIEVIYGPASVAYGTNAVSGLINIITNSHSEKPFEITTLAGNFNTFSTSANYAYANDKKNFAVNASGMYKQSDKANLRGEAGDNNWTGLMDNFENDYSIDLKIRKDNFIFGTNYLQKEVSAATFIKSVGTMYLDYGTLWNIRFINNYLKYNKSFSDHLTLNSVLYNRNTTVLNNSVLYVVDTAQFGYYRPNNLTGWETTINYSAGRIFSITSGILLESEQLAQNYSITQSNSFESKPARPEKPDMDNNLLLSVFLEPRINPVKNIYLSGGLRFDQSSVYDQVLSPRAGIIYKLYKHSFRLSYAEAFRAPKPWDYTDGLGNPSLLPERMKSLEAAITFSLSDNIVLDLIGYKNKLSDAFVTEILSNGYRWTNGGEIKTKGIEVFFRYSSKNFKSTLNYTFNESFNENNDFVPEISKHTGNFSATYIFDKYLKINLRANYVGKRENPSFITATNSSTVDPYLIFNGALTLTTQKDLTVQLIAKNIFNATYYHTSNRPPERYRQPQRTVMISLTYAIKN